jgi:hypothetical protein
MNQLLQLIGFFHVSSRIKISKSTADVGGARVLASLQSAKGKDFLPDAVGGMKLF